MFSYLEQSFPALVDEAEMSPQFLGVSNLDLKRYRTIETIHDGLIDAAPFHLQDLITIASNGANILVYPFIRHGSRTGAHGG